VLEVPTALFSHGRHIGSASEQLDTQLGAQVAHELGVVTGGGAQAVVEVSYYDLAPCVEREPQSGYRVRASRDGDEELAAGLQALEGGGELARQGHVVPLSPLEGRSHGVTPLIYSATTVTLIVLASVGVGALPDARNFGDEGAHTLDHTLQRAPRALPNLQRLGLGNIAGVSSLPPAAAPLASHG